MVNFFHLGLVSASLRPVLIGNELAHVHLLHSIVVRHGFEIDPTESDASSYEGRYYSNKPPGYPFFLTPLYAVFAALTGKSDISGAFLCAKIVNAHLSAMTAVLVFLFLSTFDIRRGAAVFGVSAAVVGTLFPAYSCLANSIPLSVFLSVLVVLCVRLASLGVAPVLWRAVAVFCIALAVTVDYSNLLVLAPVALLVGLDLRPRHYWFSVLPALVPIGLLMLYNWSAFGSPLTLSYSHYVVPSYVPWDGVDASFSLANLPRGLFGLLLSPARGLFVLSPVALLGCVTLGRWARARDREGMAIAAMVVGGIGMLSAYDLWHGGHSVGYRHVLVPAVILAMLSGLTFARLAPRWRSVAGVLLLVSTISGVGSFLVQLRPDLLRLTWKEEPADVHADYYRELLLPALRDLVGRGSPEAVDSSREDPGPAVRPAPGVGTRAAAPAAGRPRADG